MPPKNKVGKQIKISNVDPSSAEFATAEKDQSILSIDKDNSEFDDSAGSSSSGLDNNPTGRFGK